MPLLLFFISQGFILNSNVQCTNIKIKIFNICLALLLSTNEIFTYIGYNFKAEDALESLFLLGGMTKQLLKSAIWYKSLNLIRVKLLYTGSNIYTMLPNVLGHPSR